MEDATNAPAGSLVGCPVHAYSISWLRTQTPEQIRQATCQCAPAAASGHDESGPTPEGEAASVDVQ